MCHDEIFKKKIIETETLTTRKGEKKKDIQIERQIELK